MTFYDWIFSIYPKNSGIKGAWGTLHIVTLVAIIGIIIGLSFFRSKRLVFRRRTIILLAALILCFELARRIINLLRGNTLLLDDILYILLPRPWCAISCWLVIFSAVWDKKWLYNLASTSAIICALIFFAYPMVGFNNRYILFENLYSIGTHALLMIGGVSMITLRLTDFQYKTAWKEGIGLAAIFLYAFIEIFVLKIESDPLYFMPGNDAQDIIGVDYPVYLVLYVLFLCVYFGAFYFVTYYLEKKNERKYGKKRKKKKKR